MTEHDRADSPRGALFLSATDGLIESLLSDGPPPDLAVRLQLFGQFVGRWDLEWTGTGHDGDTFTTAGRLVFGWILCGRAVQDTWQVPTDPAVARRMRPFHGTTIRFFDPELDAWRSTWIDPLNSNVRRFVGRPTPTGILLDPIDGPRNERWTFSEILGDSFTWRAEASIQGSWLITETMRARRISSPDLSQHPWSRNEP
jgi:hypothetical protein